MKRAFLIFCLLIISKSFLLASSCHDSFYNILSKIKNEKYSSLNRKIEIKNINIVKNTKTKEIKSKFKITVLQNINIKKENSYNKKFFKELIKKGVLTKGKADKNFIKKDSQFLYIQQIK